MLKILDAWSNSIIISLSESLQEHDYNKQFRTNYYQFLQKKERKKERKDIKNPDKAKKKAKKVGSL
jgi:hypothetical protein